MRGKAEHGRDEVKKDRDENRLRDPQFLEQVIRRGLGAQTGAQRIQAINISRSCPLFGLRSRERGEHKRQSHSH